MEELNTLLESPVTVGHLVGIYIGLVIAAMMFALLDEWRK